MPGTEQIRLRPLRSADLEWLFTRELRPDGETWLAKQERGERFIAVAEADGLIIGKAGLDLVRYEGEPIAYVFGFGVLPAWRSRGVGSKIETHLTQIAAARGFRALRCHVAKHNPRALAWYERLGYRRIGEGVIRWTEGGVRVVETDCWELERLLDREPA